MENRLQTPGGELQDLASLLQNCHFIHFYISVCGESGLNLYISETLRKFIFQNDRD